MHRVNQARFNNQTLVKFMLAGRKERELWYFVANRELVLEPIVPDRDCANLCALCFVLPHVVETRLVNLHVQHSNDPLKVIPVSRFLFEQLWLHF
jgi:hypothetical protein